MTENMKIFTFIKNEIYVSVIFCTLNCENVLQLRSYSAPHFLVSGESLSDSVVRIFLHVLIISDLPEIKMRQIDQDGDKLVTSCLFA